MPLLPSAAPRPQTGLTLIELLVVIAIAAIVLGIGIPSLQSSIVANRLASQANELHTALQFARSEALRRNASVSLSHRGAAGSNDWSSGWRSFVTATGEELRIAPALVRPLGLRASQTIGDTLSFDARGRASSAGAFVLCHDDVLVSEGAQRSRVLLINGAGRIRTGQDANRDGVIETDTGVVTSCAAP